MAAVWLEEEEGCSKPVLVMCHFAPPPPLPLLRPLLLPFTRPTLSSAVCADLKDSRDEISAVYSRNHKPVIN